MDIKLKSISVSGIKPINQFNYHLKKINLVYGKNEQGKTNLVDYLLQSLFKGQHNTRALPTNGALMVDGLKENLIKFYPDQKVKFESYLLSEEESNQTDLSRLCVVKGGDLSFDTNTKNSLPFQTIKNYLSDQKTFDRIAKKIQSKSELTCSVENGELITGDNKGEVKIFNRKIDGLKEIDGHIQKISNDTSAQSIFQTTKKLTELNLEIRAQQLAKQHLAYTLSQQIEQKEQEAKKYPEGVIEKARNLMNDINSINKDLDSSKDKLRNSKVGYKDLEWLIQAELSYSNIYGSSTKQWVKLFPILIVLFALIGVGLAFYSLPWFALFAWIIAVAIYFIQQAMAASDENKFINKENEKILAELGHRLGLKNPSLPALKEAREKQKDAQNDAKHIEENIRIATANLLLKRNELIDLQNKYFPHTAGNPLTFSLLFEFDEKRISLKNESGGLRDSLDSLGVAQSEYQPEPTSAVFDQRLFETINNEQNILADQLETDKESAQNIAHDAAGCAGLPVTSKLDEILDALRTKRDEVEAELVGRRAEIFAMLSVKDALDEHQKNELSLIQTTLTSTTCGKILQQITGHYHSITIEDEKLVVRGEFDSFSLSELSTGTQEQVLLAVRLGLLNHVLKGRKSFLILDDAFQHSDWDRRENLIDVLANLAHDGWQILYFTMDDHIRDLFEKKLKPQFSEEYQLIDLGAT